MVNKVMVIVFLLLLPNAGNAQSTKRPQAKFGTGGTFFEARGLPEVLPSVFEFSTSRFSYRIADNGRGQQRDSQGAKHILNLRSNKADLIERIRYAEYERDVLLVCDVTDGDGGAGFILRLDENTRRIEWKQWIPSFNIGQGAIEEQHAYLSALGFIAKLNLKSGKYLWRHDNLFRGEDTFNAFEAPKLEGDTVSFREVTTYNPPAKTILVDKRSGKIKSIN